MSGIKGMTRPRTPAAIKEAAIKRLVTREMTTICSKCEGNLCNIDIKGFECDYDEIVVEKACHNCGTREYYVYKISGRYVSRIKK